MAFRLAYENLRELYQQKELERLRHQKRIEDLKTLTQVIETMIYNDGVKLRELEQEYSEAETALKDSIIQHYKQHGESPLDTVTVTVRRNQVDINKPKEKELIDYLRLNGEERYLRTKYELDKRPFNTFALKLAEQFPEQDWFTVKDDYDFRWKGLAE